MGFSDLRIAKILNVQGGDVRKARHHLGVRPGFWTVDTCAGEFESNTPYYYSTYLTAAKPPLKIKNAVVVLGSGPNRIGQAIEFDYGCVQGIRALRQNGHPSVMINSNPETVSTDYDTSDYLFFEPLTLEHILEILDFIQPQGVCVQLGGQTPINLAESIQKNGHTIIGSSVTSISAAEDRNKFSLICQALGLRLPIHQTATTPSMALESANKVGFPVICRPSFVLGGRKMEVLGTVQEMEDYLKRLGDSMSVDSPLLIDQFLEDALEVDVDLICDSEKVLIGGIVEHIEGAGVHSGDSMGVLPPQRLTSGVLNEVERLSRELALALKIKGHLNLQLAIKDGDVYVLEANPRSSRSVPFVSKATGIPLIKLGMGVQLGQPLHVNHYWRKTKDISVKGVVFPFKKFLEADTLLGPEMRSTGESMGRSSTQNGLAQYSEALEKAFIGAGVGIPTGGQVFLSIRDRDKKNAVYFARDLLQAGFKVLATGGTAAYLNKEGVTVTAVNKVAQGSPHCVDMIRNGEVQLVINTTSGSRSIQDSFSIRRSCVERNIPCLTEVSAVEAFINVIKLRHSQKVRLVQVSALSPLDA
jgi:carbamoyl-phosphate synthase large subunit